jgi:hypothetical protein
MSSTTSSTASNSSPYKYPHLPTNKFADELIQTAVGLRTQTSVN